MFCQQCGHEIPSGATACPGCGFVPLAPPPVGPAAAVPPSPGSSDPVEQILSETKRAAKELAEASARLSKRLVAKAQTAAKDPTGSAKRAAQKVAKELDSAAREIDRILKEL